MDSQNRYSWLLFIAFAALITLGVTQGQAEEPKYDRISYTYMSLSRPEIAPEGFGCFWGVEQLAQRGVVIGNMESPVPEYCLEGLAEQWVVEYKDGFIRPLAPGVAITSNEKGIGGGKVFDAARNAWRAALFNGEAVEILPLLSETELGSYVTSLTNSGLALVVSEVKQSSPPEAGNWQFALYRSGRWEHLDFGSELVLPSTLRMNNEGVIGGNLLGALPSDLSKPDRAFRYNSRIKQLTTLAPLPRDVFSFANDINDRSRVLGYSLDEYGVSAKIGVWGPQGLFRTYFDEASRGFVSDRLRFNDVGHIAVSGMRGNQLFLIPRPGVLLDLVEPTLGFPDGLAKGYTYVNDIDDCGNILGSGDLSDPNTGKYIRNETFILQRTQEH